MFRCFLSDTIISIILWLFKLEIKLNNKELICNVLTQISKQPHISKFLSLILRHKPATIKIELDKNGWTNVKSLIEKSNIYGIQFDSRNIKHSL